jgi:hypothetical protein
VGVTRKDDKHNEDLVDEISDSFNRAVAKKQQAGDPAHDADPKRPAPRFVVTGDQRVPPKRPR